MRQGLRCGSHRGVGSPSGRRAGRGGLRRDRGGASSSEPRRACRARRSPGRAGPVRPGRGARCRRRARGGVQPGDGDPGGGPREPTRRRGRPTIGSVGSARATWWTPRSRQARAATCRSRSSSCTPMAASGSWTSRRRSRPLASRARRWSPRRRRPGSPNTAGPGSRCGSGSSTASTAATPFGRSKRPLAGRPVELGAESAYRSSVTTDDAASAVVAALDAPSGVYNVVDDRPLPRGEYVDALAHALGVPSPAARSVTVELPPSFSVMLRSLRVSNQRFKETTGWQPRFPSAWEGWAAVIGDWRAHRARAGLA